MEAKRQNIQVATATPVPKAGIPSKTNVGKTTSEVSMTPSQMAAAEAAKARKHPLDALSRSVIGRGMEKRSGLQDVDDEFLKQNFFARHGFGRHSGLNDGNLYTTSMKNTHAAGQPSGMAQNAAMQQQHMANLTTSEAAPPVQYIPTPTMANPQQMQQMQQQMQQPIQQSMQPTMQQSLQQQPQIHQPAAQQQIPNQAVPNQVPMSPSMPAAMPAAGQPSGMTSGNMPQMHTPSQQHIQTPQQTPMHTTPSQHMHQVPVTPSQTNAIPQNIPQQMLQQVPAPMPTQQPVNIPPPQPEPDMCTTCPNCQTTIYLVRPDAAEMQQIQQAVN